MTVAIFFSGLRIVLALLIMRLMTWPGLGWQVASAVLFLIAAGTDWMDGYWARRFGQVTSFGALLDPIADKILVLGVLAVFVWLGVVAAWMVVVIAVRELAVTAYRLEAARRRIVISAAKEGKHKTGWQMLTIALGFGFLCLRALPAPHPMLEQWFPMLITASMWIAMVLTVSSGAQFFWHNRALWRHATAR